MRGCVPSLPGQEDDWCTLPEEVSDGFCLFGDTLVWPAGEPEVAEAALLSCVQVAQTQHSGDIVLQSGCSHQRHLKVTILFAALCRPVASTLLLRGRNKTHSHV